MKNTSISLMKLAKELGILKLAEELGVLSKQRATGKLIVKNQAGEVILHLFYGRLLYATGGFHSVRRWNRALKQHCPDWVIEPAPLWCNKPWEYQLLHQGICENQLTVPQAKSVIRSVALEVLLSLGNYKGLQREWEASPETDLDISLSLALSYLEVEPVLTKAVQMHQQWQTAGLSNLNPNLAPVLTRQVDSQSLSGWGKYLNGQLPLWDIAWQLNKSVIAVTRTLLPLVNKGLLRFQEIPDLPVPISKQPTTTRSGVATQPSTSSQKQFLIACIDDSPVVAQTLKRFLVPAGYQILSIQDSMRGIAQLAQHKPDLIFLDLIMPNANGYTVCKFLRNTPLFQKTPIIILTGRDTIIDRTRAKLVGASGFLGKPPERQKTLQLIQKHLSALQEAPVAQDLVSPEVPSFAS